MSKKSELPEWPENGRNYFDIFQELFRYKRMNISYDKDFVIGFPGTTPLLGGVMAYFLFAKDHSNNIGTHTGKESERGFCGTQELERKVVYLLGQLFGSTDIHGYVSSGGTEGNIMGMLLGREYFNHLNSGPVSIITSIFSHYSIRKAAWILNISRESWRKCDICSNVFGRDVNHLFDSHGMYGNSFDMIGCNDKGSISVDALERVILDRYSDGKRNFLIVLSYGNVMTGAVDNIDGIDKLLQRLQGNYQDANFYIHIDAAFGGFVVPFINNCTLPTKLLDFKFVYSISLDPHKMGLAPYPAGVFLYKKNINDLDLMGLLGVQMGYVPGGTDGTLIGSRPGASAAACYTVFSRLGINGYKGIVNKCMDLASFLKEKLQQIDGINVIDNDMNVVSFFFDNPRFELREEFVDEVKLVHHFFPIDFSNPDDHVRKLYKVTCMPHVNEHMITEFVEKLKLELK